ncbi:hypothetical protein [Burkholderia arboris]|uniref:hypothetical protein n=1 Tax=Burkholderia arboris TaxID=488730 RepID=UPI0030EFFE01
MSNVSGSGLPSGSAKPRSRSSVPECGGRYVYPVPDQRAWVDPMHPHRPVDDLRDIAKGPHTSKSGKYSRECVIASARAISVGAADVAISAGNESATRVPEPGVPAGTAADERCVAAMFIRRSLREGGRTHIAGLGRSLTTINPSGT